MKRVVTKSGQFKKDITKLKKQGKDLAKIKYVLELLIEGKRLPPKCVDHPLRGQWRGSRDCHIEPDCVLIYTIDKMEIRFERIGSHSELFR